MPRQPIILTSPTVKPGQPIPRLHTAQGANTSPALAWGPLPTGTKELVVALEHTDSTYPLDPVFFCWMVYNIPATVKGLPAKLPAHERLMSPPGLDGVYQAGTRYDVYGYRGPEPPVGKAHRYRFVVYALNASRRLKPSMFANSVLAAIQPHIIGEGELRATFTRT